ncbi:MAG: toll/interleukin-1 receptor domain-containing protein [Paludibacteraceae bacterium]|nr:toll/interleukin-1 receptor domain-containing protein [Paludibacteraceae bacterium]
MSKIFISYARKDKDEVYPIVDELERNGFDCWIDKNGIESGDQFKNVILDAIDGCEIFIYMLSANTLASDWCQKEFNYANGFKKIIPVLLKGAKENRRLMFDFSTLDCIDIYDSMQKEKFIRDLKKWTGGDVHSYNAGVKEKSSVSKENDNSSIIFDDEIDPIFGNKSNVKYSKKNYPEYNPPTMVYEEDEYDPVFGKHLNEMKKNKVESDGDEIDPIFGNGKNRVHF